MRPLTCGREGVPQYEALNDDVTVLLRARAVHVMVLSKMKEDHNMILVGRTMFHLQIQIFISKVKEA